MHKIFLGLIVLVTSGVTLTTCNPVPLTAPNEATIAVQANPKSIPAVGGASTITATVFKAAGDGGGTVADGTQVFFTTDIGIIEERVATRNGIARATLQSTGRAGQATVTASSGAVAAQTVTVEIGAGTGGELTITVVANPSLLGPADFTSDIVATVTDDRGNFIPDVPIIFSTNAGSLASQGAVVRTNANGQAFDRLTLLDDTTTTISVTATSGSSSGSVDITRADFAAPIIDFVSPSSGNKGQTRTITIGGQNFQPGSTVSFGVGIGIDVVTFINSETLEAVITIDGTASSGSRDVRVTNPDGDSGTLTGGFTVN